MNYNDKQTTTRVPIIMSEACLHTCTANWSHTFSDIFISINMPRPSCLSDYITGVDICRTTCYFSFDFSSIHVQRNTQHCSRSMHTNAPFDEHHHFRRMEKKKMGGIRSPLSHWMHALFVQRPNQGYFDPFRIWHWLAIQTHVRSIIEKARAMRHNSK